jgi:hypothetical protein
MSDSKNQLVKSGGGLGFSMSDIEIPKLNVIQKMSQINGPVGSVVIDKDSVLLEAEERVPVVIVGAVKKFKEDVPFDSDTIPKIVSTEDEARVLAEESEFDILEFAELVLLIKQPEGAEEDLYPYLIGGENYQIARITVQKDAYRLTYKRLYTFQTFNPEVNAASRLWSFGTELMTKGKYSWYVPSLNITKEETPEDVVTFVNRITGKEA